MSPVADGQLVDVCVNLLNSQLHRDMPGILQRAHQACVGHIVITATDLTTTEQAINLCDPAASPALVTTAGVHPHDAKLPGTDDGLPVDWIERLQNLAQHPAVRAIGETGLDFNRNYVPHDEQRTVFETQISLAQALNKPLFVHDRDTDGAVLATLAQAGPLPPVVIHCFTGTRAELAAYIDAGYYVGITGWVADPQRGAELRDMVHLIPGDKLLLETDAPFLKPKTIPADYHLGLGLSARDKGRNEPAFLPFVAEVVAAARAEDVAKVIAQTTANAKRFFSLS